VTLINVEVIAHTPASLDSHFPGRTKSSAPPSPGLRPHSCDGPSCDERVRGDGRDKGLLEEWMLTMLNRIAINVKVEIQNMVFKYETDSFVSSVSWKVLKLEPCNHKWQPAFADFHGPSKASFQSLMIQDVTWCLDPLDNAQNSERGGGRGSTRNFQAPIFNREQISIRIIRRRSPDGAPHLISFNPHLISSNPHLISSNLHLI
jgi:hypothetical protein